MQHGTLKALNVGKNGVSNKWHTNSWGTHICTQTSFILLQIKWGHETDVDVNSDRDGRRSPDCEESGLCVQ